MNYLQKFIEMLGVSGGFADTFLYVLYGILGAVAGTIVVILIAATACYIVIVIFLLILQSLGLLYVAAKERFKNKHRGQIEK